MKFLWHEKVYGWWSVTGLIGNGGNWFFGFSCKPPSPAQPLLPTGDPRTRGVKGRAPGDPCTFPNCKGGQCCMNPSNARPVGVKGSEHGHQR